MSGRPLILLVNDDGIHAPGLSALRDSLGNIGEIWVAAPHMERSANSHAITIHHPLFVEKIADKVFAIEGTPADCVKVALNKLLPQKPDWVISGINRGANLGHDTLYSGTCAAALEAAIFKLRTMAVSLHGRSKNMDYTLASTIAAKIVGDKNFQDFAGFTLNLNVPHIDHVKGLKVVSLGERSEDEPMIQSQDPRGRAYYWLGGGFGPVNPIPDSDLVIIEKGYATLSVLQPNLFHEDENKRLARISEGWHWS